MSKGCVLVKAIGLKMVEDLHNLFDLPWKDKPSYAKSFRIFEIIWGLETWFTKAWESVDEGLLFASSCFPSDLPPSMQHSWAQNPCQVLQAYAWGYSETNSISVQLKALKIWIRKKNVFKKSTRGDVFFWESLTNLQFRCLKKLLGKIRFEQNFAQICFAQISGLIHPFRCPRARRMILPLSGSERLATRRIV